MSSQIKKKFIEANAIDGSKIQIQNDEALRIKKQGGTDQEVFKLDTTDKLQFLISPRMAFDPVDSDELARKGYVDQKISDLVNGAPALLDTLNELAAAIGNDENFATTFTNAVSNLQSQIDAISGVGLTSIQAELDATQAGAGLELNGAYLVPVGSNYLGSATSLKVADSFLDAQLKVVADGLAQEILDRIADVDAEESARIAEDLTMVKLDGSRAMTGNLSMGTHGIVDSTGMSGASMTISATSGNMDVTAAAGTMTVSGNEVVIDSPGADLSLGSGSSVVVTAPSMVIDAELNLVNHNITNAASINCVDGSGNEGYLDAQSVNLLGGGEQVVLTTPSLEAINNFQINSTSGEIAIQSLGGAVHIASSSQVLEIGGAVITNFGGASADGGFTLNATNGDVSLATSGPSGGEVTVESELQNVILSAPAGQVSVIATKLDMGSVKIENLANGSVSSDAATFGQLSSVQSELDATQVGAGLGTDGSYSAPVGSNYLGMASSLKDADSKLDAQIKTVADGLAQELLDRAADVDAEEARAMAAEAVLAGRASALEAASVEFVQQKFTLSAGDISNGYVALSNLAYGASINAFVDRLAIHETDDYTVSVVGGVTRITFAGSLVTPGQEKLSAGDVVRVKYAKVAIA